MTTLTPAARALGDHPAFPYAMATVSATGLTKREYFATQVLSGSFYGKATADEIAASVIEQVDALLNALASEHQPEQPKDDDGWIEWKGGECPVPPETIVDARWRSGIVDSGSKAGDWGWEHENRFDPIVAYRIVTPAKPEPSDTTGIAMKGATDNPMQDPKPSRDLRTIAGGGTLTLKAGKTYRNGVGDIVKIGDNMGFAPFRFRASIDDQYTISGYCRDSDKQSHLNLIELVEGE